MPHIPWDWARHRCHGNVFASSEASTPQHSIQNWVSMKFCKWKQLKSLIGLLHDASIAVRPDRTFIRRLIDTLIQKSSNHRHGIALTASTNRPSPISCGGIASSSSGMVCQWWQTTGNLTQISHSRQILRDLGVWGFLSVVPGSSVDGRRHSRAYT
jgi:hypothetical protein